MATAIDPVCGMEVDTDKAIRVQHGDHTHYFCSEACRDKFLADPARYGDAHAAHGGHMAAEENPPITVDEHGIAAPRFGSAGSGGAEFEPLPPGARD
jgi:YHS domain-containing protein